MLRVSMDARVVSEIAALLRFGSRGSLKADLPSNNVCKLQMSLYSTNRMWNDQNGQQELGNEGKKGLLIMYWI